MGFFDRIAKHEALFQGMADRLGVDFSSWVATQPDHVGDYRSAVLSCTACTEAGACASWQEAHATSDHTPGYCRNKRLLEALSRA